MTVNWIDTLLRFLFRCREHLPVVLMSNWSVAGQCLQMTVSLPFRVQVQKSACNQRNLKEIFANWLGNTYFSLVTGGCRMVMDQPLRLCDWGLIHIVTKIVT